jgi:hypothetical protein
MEKATREDLFLALFEAVAPPRTPAPPCRCPHCHAPLVPALTTPDVRAARTELDEVCART